MVHIPSQIMQDLPDKSWRLRAMCIILLTSSLMTMLLRFYTRMRIIRAIGVDDWIMLFTTLAFTIFVAGAIAASVYGVGRHVSDLSEYEVSQALKFWWFSCIWYGFTVAGSRLAIGTFLLRLSVRRAHSYLIYGIMATSVVIGVIFFFISLFQCRPISYFWDKTQEGTCINVKVIAGLIYPYSAFSMVSDFAFALLPIFMIQGLQMNRRTKIALVPILGMGCIASVAIAIRFGFMYDTSEPDFMWHTISIAILSTAEQGLAITAGNLATLRPLVRVILRKLGWMQTEVEQQAPVDARPTIGHQERNRPHRLGDLETGITVFTGTDLNSPMLEMNGAWQKTENLGNGTQDRLRTQESWDTISDLKDAEDIHKTAEDKERDT